jgi:site-specific recombinase XerD
MCPFVIYGYVVYKSTYRVTFLFVALKKVTTDSLRHIYATHLLEMDMDIMSLKDLLGSQ